MKQKQYDHWQLTTDDDGILWLYLDRKDSRTNTLNAEIFTELDHIITAIEQDRPRGVVLASAKENGFIAGADINQFIELETVQQAYDLIRKSQLIFSRWQALPAPTVAMIRGFCLGGGAEFTLACRYRIADEDQSTRIGLPEVKLGIHPGWGGTVRLPLLVGAPQAMAVMLAGRTLSARAARRLGMVDVVVPQRQLRRAAREMMLNPPKPHTPSLSQRASNLSFVRPWLGKLFSKKLASKVRQDHYPAPYAIVDNWVRYGVGSGAMEREAQSIAELMMTPTARQLVRVFFLQERLKRLGKGKDWEVRHVHVIGAGTMGGDIAAWCAFKGLQVTLQDQSPELIAPAMKRAFSLFKKKLKQERLVQAALDRLVPDVSGLGVHRADLVIEAIFEDLEAKQTTFKQVEPLLKPDAVLATNTSSIPLAEIAKVLQRPERLVGIHFFNPVAQMPLVEVVSARSEGSEAGVTTEATVVGQALSFVGQIGRLPVPVVSRPGFLVNRILVPYLMEAMTLLNEGISGRAIDQAALNFGMPMGPIALADAVGLDVCLSVAKNLAAQMGVEVPKRLETLVTAGNLGVKSGRGFYRYKEGKPVLIGQGSKAPRDTVDRLILRMVNEGVACLSEQIVEDADLLDAGMIFGTGFAPFRGGLLQYAKDRGYSSVYQLLKQLAATYGDRFQPVDSPLWAEDQGVEQHSDGPEGGSEGGKDSKGAS